FLGLAPALAQLGFLRGLRDRPQSRAFPASAARWCEPALRKSWGAPLLLAGGSVPTPVASPTFPVTTAKPPARYGAICGRACGRLCSTELHHHWGHYPVRWCNLLRAPKKPQSDPSFELDSAPIGPQVIRRNTCPFGDFWHGILQA